MPYKMTDDEEPQLLNSLTPGTSDQSMPPPPPPVPPQLVQEDGKNYQFTPGPGGSLIAPGAGAPKAPPLTANPQVAKSMRLPGMPPTMSIDDIGQYLAKNKSGLDKYGSQAQMDLQNQLNQRRESFGNKLTEGTKGFADALMMGVARAGDPGFQQQYNAQENQFSKDQMDALRGANEANYKETEGKMTLDKMNPNSSISKSAQGAYGPLFEKLGYPANRIKGMSAANIDNTLNLMTQYGGKEMEAQIKEYELEIERARLGQVTAKVESDERTAEENQRLQAAKELASQTANKQVFGLPVPFTKSPTAASEIGTKFLTEKLNEGQTGPYGATTSRGGVTYEWSPVTQKYHKKQ